MKFIPSLLAALAGAIAPLEGAVWTVVNTADSGTGSLRWAIDQANGNAGPDDIRFNIPGPAPYVIGLHSQLPHVDGQGTRIMGETQPGYAGQPSVYLNGRLFGTVPFSNYRGCGIVVFGNDCAVTGLGFQAFLHASGDSGSSDIESSCAVRLHGLNGRVAACRFGFDWNSNGEDGLGPNRTGDVCGVLVRGTANLIEDCLFGYGGTGVKLAGTACRDNLVRRCRFGLSADGLVNLPDNIFGSPNGLNVGVSVTEGALRSRIGEAGQANWFACAVGIESRGGRIGLADLFSDGTSITGNRFGLGIDSRAVPHLKGIEVSGGTRGLVIGGAAAGEENYFCSQVRDLTDYSGPRDYPCVSILEDLGSGASGAGSDPERDPSVTLTANVFGLNPAGDARPNAGDTLACNSRRKVLMSGNTVRHCRNGVVAGPGGSVQVRDTSFGDLTGIPIDNIASSASGPDGPTPWDLTDNDTGGNDLMNQPVLQGISFNPGTFVTTVQGRVFTRPGRSVQLQLFSSPWNPAIPAAARLYLGTTSVVTDASGSGLFTFDLPGFYSGRTFTAFATDLSALNPQTSEMSDPMTPASGRLRIATLGLALSESSGAGTLRIVRTGGSYGPATATLQVTGSAVALPADYQFPGGLTVSFANGETEKLVSLSAVNDALHEDTEYFTVGLVDVTGALSADSAVAVVSIGDNDPMPVPVVGNQTVSEAAGNATVPIQLSAPAGKVLSVRCTTVDMSANGGADFVAIDAPLVFAPGVTSVNQTVQILNDTLGEPTETFGVRAAIGDGGATTGLITITDDDTPPVTGFHFTSASLVVSESAGLAPTRIARTGDTSTRVDLIIGVHLVSAEAADIFGAGPYTLTFFPGVGEMDFSLAVWDDDIDEDDEEYFLSIDGASSGGPITVLAPSAIGVKILDNDDKPKISLSSGFVLEGNSGTAVYRPGMSFMLDHPSERAVSFIATPDYAGFADGDFWYWDPFVYFPPGATTASLNCGILEDLIYESDESLFVEFSDPVNGGLADSSGTLTLLNDDADERRFYFGIYFGEPALATYAVGEGYEIFFKVMRAGRIDLAGQVAVVVGNSSGDVLLSQQRFEFAPGEFEKEVRIFIVDDLLHEGTETIRLSLKPEDGISTTGASSEIDLVIADNDAPPKVSVQDATVTEADDVAVNLYFNFTLSAPSALQVKVLGISTANLTATNADYGAISVPELIFEPGETSKEVRVIVAGDWLDEFPEQFHLDIASANGATLERNRAVGTILDNDLALREYRNWLPGYFPPGERSDNTRVSPCADPDRDGMSNAIEFILGGDPRNAASGPERMSLVVTGGFVVWQAVVPISRAADLGLYVEESDDLTSWTGPASSLTAEAAGAANVRLIWRHPLTTPRKFLRLGAPCPPFAPEP